MQLYCLETETCIKIDGSCYHEEDDYEDDDYHDDDHDNHQYCPEGTVSRLIFSVSFHLPSHESLVQGNWCL